jgi:hexosaminidase
MKKILISLAVLSVLFSCAEKQKDTEISILPQPQAIRVDEGVFEVDKATKIYMDLCTDEMKRVAGFINEKFAKAAGFELEIVDRMPEENFIAFMNAGMPTESYVINAKPHGVFIDYGDGAGAFYAVQTLFQLLPTEIYAQERQKGIDWTVPCCSIDDAPRFKYRGMHLDVCLHYFDFEFLKRYIDIMAAHKVNRFHWHLTEDQGWRIEIKKYPLLTEKGQWRKETVVGSLFSGVYDGIPHGGYYTQEQVKELVQYAAERYVTIIPEIELPGHALAAIACYPELSCGLEDHYETATKWGVFKQVYCTKESTFKFLEDVFDEVFELFPSELIHIGGDECPKASWKACPHCQSMIKKLGLKDEFELQSYFVTRMEKYINSKGRQIIGWDEILQGGLAPNAKVMSWLGEEGGIKAAQQHHEVVMSPHQKYYLDYWQADPYTEPLAMGGPTTLKMMYDYEPVPDVLTSQEARYIIGVEGCVWTEYMPTPERVEYMAWPRMCAIAETGWTQADKDWDGFTRRLEKHLGRLDGMNVGYCKAFFNPMIVFHKDTKHNMVVSMTVDAPGAEIRYTLDGSAPTIDSPKYEIPFSINRSQVVSAQAFRDGKPVGEVRTKRI